MLVNGASRAPATLAGAAIAGVLLWVAAAHIDRHTTGGYWAAYGIVAGAGLAFGLLQLRGGGGHPPAMLFGAFLPVLIVAGWVIVGMEPHPNWFRDHVLSWSGDMHIRDVVHSVATWLGVLAFGIGYTLAATFEPLTRRRVVETPAAAPAMDERAADEPMTAERGEVVEEPDGTRETVTR
jgi:hypothetical protein